MWHLADEERVLVPLSSKIRRGSNSEVFLKICHPIGSGCCRAMLPSHSSSPTVHASIHLVAHVRARHVARPQRRRLPFPSPLPPPLAAKYYTTFSVKLQKSVRVQTPKWQIGRDLNYWTKCTTAERGREGRHSFISADFEYVPTT